MPEAEQKSTYLLAGQAPELERLQLQSRVWEPAGEELLNSLPARLDRALEVGCGAMGWLRILSRWVNPGGSVVGTDIDDRMLAAAQSLVSAEGLTNISLVRDNLFESQLPRASFDLVHARFQIAPLGRAREQMAAFLSLAKPDGWIVLEEPDISSWRINPDSPATERLIELIRRGFAAAGGDFSAGRTLPALLREYALRPEVTARVIALEPGHPYLRLPLQFAASLRPRLEVLEAPDTINDLLRVAEDELSVEGAWGTTFTLIQASARLSS